MHSTIIGLIFNVCDCLCPFTRRAAARNTNDTASHASPTITFHSLDVAVTIGNEAYVECFAEGVPQPTVSWTFLEADTSFFSFLQQSPSLSTLPSGTLWLQSVKQSDAGRYECLAENSQGRIQAIVNVRVLGKSTSVA